MRHQRWREPPAVPQHCILAVPHILSSGTFLYSITKTATMSASKDIIVAFDLYGTLLSTESIAKKLSEHFGEEKAATLAADWRKYQLEYTWRLNSMSV